MSHQNNNNNIIIITHHFTPNLAFAKANKSCTYMKFTNAYPTLHPRKKEHKKITRKQVWHAPFWKSILKYIKSIFLGHTFPIYAIKSLSPILFGIFLIITVVRVS